MTNRRAELGKRGEAQAVKRLKAMGYKVLQTNYRARRSEIDVVAEKGKTLVFIEVRTKASTAFGRPEESISSPKRTHLVAAAQEYLQEHRAFDRDWRIDLVAVEYGPDGRLSRLDVVEHAVEG
jgi:putative endonuclease